MRAVVEWKQKGMGPGPPHPAGEIPHGEAKPESGDSLAGQRRFVGATGLSAVRELAVSLGLADLDDSGLWEAV